MKLSFYFISILAVIGLACTDAPRQYSREKVEHPEIVRPLALDNIQIPEPTSSTEDALIKANSSKDIVYGAESLGSGAGGIDFLTTLPGAEKALSTARWSGNYAIYTEGFAVNWRTDTEPRLPSQFILFSDYLGSLKLKEPVSGLSEIKLGQNLAKQFSSKSKCGSVEVNGAEFVCGLFHALETPDIPSCFDYGLCQVIPQKSDNNYAVVLPKMVFWVSMDELVLYQMLLRKDPPEGYLRFPMNLISGKMEIGGIGHAFNFGLGDAWNPTIQKTGVEVTNMDYANSQTYFTAAFRGSSMIISRSKLEDSYFAPCVEEGCPQESIRGMYAYGLFRGDIKLGDKILVETYKEESSYKSIKAIPVSHLEYAPLLKAYDLAKADVLSKEKGISDSKEEEKALLAKINEDKGKVEEINSSLPADKELLTQKEEASAAANKKVSDLLLAVGNEEDADKKAQLEAELVIAQEELATAQGEAFEQKIKVEKAEKMLEMLGKDIELNTILHTSQVENTTGLEKELVDGKYQEAFEAAHKTRMGAIEAHGLQEDVLTLDDALRANDYKRKKFSVGRSIFKKHHSESIMGDLKEIFDEALQEAVKGVENVIIETRFTGLTIDRGARSPMVIAYYYIPAENRGLTISAQFSETNGRFSFFSTEEFHQDKLDSLVVQESQKAVDASNPSLGGIKPGMVLTIKDKDPVNGTAKLVYGGKEYITSYAEEAAITIRKATLPHVILTERINIGSATGLSVGFKVINGKSVVSWVLSSFQAAPIKNLCGLEFEATLFQNVNNIIDELGEAQNKALAADPEFSCPVTIDNESNGLKRINSIIVQDSRSDVSAGTKILVNENEAVGVIIWKEVNESHIGEAL